ncbi:polysaccharide lyase [Nocardia sp. 2]|uniref:Polysaccharide lyase n=1 Tax=Nocardia acididurans TaxID=2802282 RepID=A0ABS1M4L3_9NOCA|nr:polysaccharide lyase [Nocardia acididurans]MBL1074078.1 polysaccharide lyase [Nocardia acididurans]
MRKPLRATLLTALLAVLVVACSPGAPPRPQSFVGDYETGDFSQWAYCQNIVVTSGPCTSYSNTDSMQVVSDTVRQGRYAARFEVDQGDTPGSICCGDRAEVSGENATDADEGDERWYQWSTRFAPNFPAGRGWSVLSQWHANADGSPPLAIGAGPTNVSEDHWGVVVSTWYAPGDPGPTYTPWSRQIVTGEWTDIKLHVKWSVEDSEGYLELWVGGVRQSFDAAPCAGEIRCRVRTLMPSGGGIYFKQGYYRDPDIEAEGIVYHDGFSVATTEAGLRPL